MLTYFWLNANDEDYFVPIIYDSISLSASLLLLKLNMPTLRMSVKLLAC